MRIRLACGSYWSGSKIDLVSSKDVDKRCRDVVQSFKDSENEVVRALEVELKMFSKTSERHQELTRLISQRPKLLNETVYTVSNKERGKSFAGFGSERKAVGIPELRSGLYELCKTFGQRLPNH